MTARVQFGSWHERPTFLFVAYNTAHKSLYVLAKDGEEARSIAWTACHIRHTDNGLHSEGRMVHLINYKPSSGWLSQYWELIQDAASEGLQGTVVFEGDKVFVGHKELVQ